MTADEAISKLRTLRASINDLRGNPFSSDYAAWERKTNITLDKIYGRDSTESIEYGNLDFTKTGAVKLSTDHGNVVVGRANFSEAATMLDSYIAEIEEFGMPEISDRPPATLMKSNKSNAIEKLNQLHQGSPDGEPFGPEFQRWSRNVETALIKIFGNQSREHHDYILTPKAHAVTGMSGNETRVAQYYQRCVSSLKALLSSSIDQIEEYGLEEDSTGTLTAKKPTVTTSPESNKVFLIHGHDQALKHEVARFLEKIGTEPIILHEQANEGQTIIEKFEKNSDVGFAVALLTPDDVGGVDPDSLQSRARQNVVFELGFFIGRIGRPRTLAIVKGGVEEPSDYRAVVYTSYDTGEWKGDLIRELKAAGFNVDANKAY